MPTTQRTIAVIDDDDGIRVALASLLDSAGFGAATYASAEAFLARPGPQRFDCLIVDVNLPGLTGPALLQQIAAGGTAPCAILISGRDDPATRALIRSAGAVPLLRKPFSDEELFAELDRLLAA